MNIITKIGLFSTITFLAACSQEEWSKQTVTGEENEIRFSSTLQESAALSSKALGAEKGEIVPLPYINGIYVRKHETEKVQTLVYHVKNGYKGTLEKGESGTPAESTEELKWGDTTNEIPFIAYTTPTGVTMTDNSSGSDDNPASGTVDFVEGNKKSDTNPAKDKLNDKSVTPLEVFISARATAKYEESPSVTLPFKHIVSKLSIRVRNWHNADITPTSITFYAIPQKWTAEQDKDNALRITKKAEGVTDALTVSFGNLDKQTVSGATYSLIYLPPLTSALGTDFATAGDFCITYSGNKYYGTLKDIDLTNGELQAGEHMRITMDLSENFGVGVGPWIANWSGPDGETTVYGQPHAGIYTLKGLEIFRDVVNNGGEIPDSLCTTVDGVRTIRLYNNISVPVDFGSIGNAGYPFTGTFDGQGYTISGISGTAGLFGTVGNETTPSDTIRNLRLSGSINGTADGIALLADTVTNAVVTNCHVAGTSSVTSTGSTIGGLVGVAGAGTTISQCSFTGTISGNTIGGIAGSFAGAAISNCFVSETGDATTPVNIAGSGTGSGTIKNSYSVIKTTETTEANAVIGYYWKEVSFSSFDKSAQFDKSGKFSTQISEAETTLLEALNANAGADTGIRWVYVYGKDFPVLEIQ